MARNFLLKERDLLIYNDLHYKMQEKFSNIVNDVIISNLLTSAHDEISGIFISLTHKHLEKKISIIVENMKHHTLKAGSIDTYRSIAAKISFFLTRIRKFDVLNLCTIDDIPKEYINKRFGEIDTQLYINSIFGNLMLYFSIQYTDKSLITNKNINNIVDLYFSDDYSKMVEFCLSQLNGIYFNMSYEDKFITIQHIQHTINIQNEVLKIYYKLFDMMTKKMQNANILNANLI